jgi:hypothetical protein
MATIGANWDCVKWIMGLIKGTSACPHSTLVRQDYTDPLATLNLISSIRKYINIYRKLDRKKFGDTLEKRLV